MPTNHGGTDCFSRFNGQWALALWNTRTRNLILSRDRIGIRPLYVHEHDGRVWFGSEVKALFADPAVPRSLNLKGLDQTFTYWASIAPTTVFTGIEELPPASVRVYGPNDEKKEWLFWSPTFPELQKRWSQDSRFPTLSDATELLREKLARATELRMLRADVPVGSYLSGGLDSSVVAKMGRGAKEGRFETFSIRFEDSEFDETEFQRLMAATLKSTHREIIVTRKDIARIFPDVIWHTERPILRTAPAPLFLLSKIVRESGIKAVLTGEGADEMLGGYDIFREAKIREFWSHAPDSKIRPLLLSGYIRIWHDRHSRHEGWHSSSGKGILIMLASLGFRTKPRWSTTSLLKKFFSNETSDYLRNHSSPESSG